MSQDKTGEDQVVYTICDSHCGGTCEMKVHVRGDKIVQVESGGDETTHRMCARGRAYRQRVYAPDRLLYPLKRTGARGSGEFVRVSWDEALDTVARELIRVRDTYGNASILHFCSMCDPHTLHHVQTFNRLLCQFGGYTKPWGTISDEGRNFAAGMTYGTRPAEHGAEEYADAKLVIMSGWNPVVTHQGTAFPMALARAKEAGTRFVCVEPRYTESVAAFADQWIPIRPGTDAALFIAMAYVIINENLNDRPFTDAYAVGFDKFSDYVLGQEDGVKKTPGWAETITGVPAGTITDLAREYASTKPAILNTGRAAGRAAFGEQYHRAASALEAITGNVVIKRSRPYGPRVSRGTARIPSPPNQVEMGMPPRWNALPYRTAGTNSSARVNVNLFTDAILKGKAGGYAADYKFLWLSNTNYLNQLGEVNKAIEAFKELEFILVTEQFMTASAKFADIVLPVCTFLERNDIRGAWGGGYALLNKAIEPLGESKSQLQICEALAPKLGITDYNDKSDEEWVRFMVAEISEQIDFPDYDTLRKQGPYKIKFDKPDALSDEDPADIKDSEQEAFATPSGKIEIYSQMVADMNHPQIPAIPKYIETWESLSDPLAEKYPLQLITPHFNRRAHSQFDNLLWLRELQPQTVAVSTLDAESRGIKDGDMVRVFNDRGEMIIPADVTERIIPGTVAVPQGAWYDPDENGVDRGGCSNMLTKNVTSPGGAFACNTALVQVEKAEQ